MYSNTPQRAPSAVTAQQRQPPYQQQNYANQPPNNQYVGLNNQWRPGTESGVNVQQQWQYGQPPQQQQGSYHYLSHQQQLQRQPIYANNNKDPQSGWNYPASNQRTRRASIATSVDTAPRQYPYATPPVLRPRSYTKAPLNAASRDLAIERRRAAAISQRDNAALERRRASTSRDIATQKRVPTSAGQVSSERRRPAASSTTSERRKQTISKDVVSQRRTSISKSIKDTDEVKKKTPSQKVQKAAEKTKATAAVATTAATVDNTYLRDLELNLQREREREAEREQQRQRERKQDRQKEIERERERNIQRDRERQLEINEREKLQLIQFEREKLERQRLDLEQRERELRLREKREKDLRQLDLGEPKKAASVAKRSPPVEPAQKEPLHSGLAHIPPAVKSFTPAEKSQTPPAQKESPQTTGIQTFSAPLPAQSEHDIKAPSTNYCNECGKKISKFSLRKHRHDDTPSKDYCEECGEKISKFSLRKHHHDSKSAEKTPAKEYCDECGKKLSKFSLRKHHHDDAKKGEDKDSKHKMLSGEHKEEHGSWSIRKIFSRENKDKDKEQLREHISTDSHKKRLRSDKTPDGTSLEGKGSRFSLRRIFSRDKKTENAQSSHKVPKDGGPSSHKIMKEAGVSKEKVMKENELSQPDDGKGSRFSLRRIFSRDKK